MAEAITRNVSHFPKRWWKLDIDGKEFISGTPLNGQDFRITADIDVQPGNSVSFADIRIYGLRKDTSVIRDKSIKLRAGFDDSHGLIFDGVIVNCFREKDGPSVVTRYLCKSSVTATDKPIINASYGPGTSLESVLKDIAQRWNRKLQLERAQFTDAAFISGYHLCDDVTVALNNLAESFGFQWTDFNGNLVVNKPDGKRTSPVHLVSASTGLIGIPERTLVDGLGVYCAVRLNPHITLRDQIRVESEYATFNAGQLMLSPISGDSSANGTYNVLSLRHRLDSKGNMWLTEIEGLEASSAKPAGNFSDSKLVWGARVSQSFREKVRDIAGRLNISPNDLMAVMFVETAGKFKSYTRAPNSSAVGLIQALKSTLAGLGYTTEQAARMTEEEQMEKVVYPYLRPYASRINNRGDLYMAIFSPKFIGKPDNTVLYSYPSPEYVANQSLDVDRSGTITRAEAVSRVDRAYLEGQAYASV
ncbi:baseplate hub protein [Pantoea agglomerans]|uniref:baseplate hub protein n=1 Tax=Enterobacter agglomerans TaxID=549 RepID=UPI002788DED0|nr:hypothetical protein [Pantoea agglomerans]MDQ0435620.1 hypothetical protein [Pantoea agglomerans]